MRWCSWPPLSGHLLPRIRRKPLHGLMLMVRLLQPLPRHTPPPSPTTAIRSRGSLGQGGKKTVYLAHDTLLDRDVAFALIKTEGLDDVSRTRITREAQAMGRLGSHPHIVTVFDMGLHGGQPYMVTELMGGGDVEGVVEKAPEHRPPLEQAIDIARSVCRGLEFAHNQGIVHRDLKPGNVWLTGDGTAKIGDFGLAVAMDRSRLTQAGMMVGTVSYMSPEQAMGGQVTPQSDLYSLGTMLYEMVTGRPPFLGDDSVAIIGQHINTPPVAPTWHNPRCPLSLEALVLRLLEKDAGKRPSSATEVLQALEAIDLEAESPHGTGYPGGVDDAPSLAASPLYRRGFVGREAELRQLHTAYDNALSGQGSLVMVVGEPGIGKTSICEQLATYVTLRGGRTLVGHCYEEGSLSLPYLAFVEAIRSYVLSRESDELRREMGSGASEVARIVSEVRDRVQVEPREPGNPEEDRYRLLQAVSEFLRNAGSVQPLLIVLEDLHDADTGTLDLLTHVARNLSGARLLLVGTYRDVEVDRSHALSGALAELRRLSSFSRVPLRGLTADEVQRMISTISEQELPWGMAQAVHRQTEGNPLFVQEVLRYLVEEGLMSRQEGRWRETPLDMNIPEGLRDVIGKRLSRLSDGCNRVLSVAAVIGREFRVDVLQGVAGVAEDELFAALEEAQGAAVVEERSPVGAVVIYRFSHALFRQTLYQEMIAPRRIRLHQQVARASEEVYGTRLDEHAAELAEHFSYSSDPGDLGKAIEYGERAARRSQEVYAYGEAARLLEQALQVQEVLDPEDHARQCDLLLALGDVLMPAGEPRRVYETVAAEAFTLAEDLADRGRSSRACQAALSALIRYSGATIVGSPGFRQWAERADEKAAPGTIDRVHADIALAYTTRVSGRWSEAAGIVARAVELARQLDDPESLFAAAYAYLRVTGDVLGQAEERMTLVEEFVQRPQAGVSPGTLGSLLFICGIYYLDSGDRGRAEEVWDQLEGLAGRTGDTFVLVWSLFIESLLALVDGHLEEGVAAQKRILDRSEELGNPMFDSFVERPVRDGPWSARVSGREAPRAVGC